MPREEERGAGLGRAGVGMHACMAWESECSRSVSIGPSLRSVGETRVEGIEDILEHAVSASAVLRGASG